MRIIQPSYEILTRIDRETILREMEVVGRTCYKSEDKITEDSGSKFIEMLIKRGHEAMIEFFDITVKFVHNRGFTHELVRHRLCSFAQESTRYVNYSKNKQDNQIKVIEPYWFAGLTTFNIHLKDVWIDHMQSAENSYMKLVWDEVPSQGARGVLPIDLKTEINIRANLREWRHIFKLRCSNKAHPDMRRVMLPLKKEFIELLPEIFGDLEV